MSHRYSILYHLLILDEEEENTVIYNESDFTFE